MRHKLRLLCLGAVLMLIPAALLAGAPPASLPAGLTEEQQAELRTSVRSLEQRLSALRSRAGGPPEHLADAEVFLKGVQWALRYEERLASADLALVRRALDRGGERTDALAAGRSPWSGRRGWLVRGYVSKVDGSVQPYGLSVPESYDPNKRIRLDVVLHGSTRPVGLSELRFMAPFDGGDAGGKAPAEQDWIELRPLGRVENCYRWAGETDVFEAIEDVCRSYAVDRDRIVLRGMSMGASGTWHLGLKHPDRFVALGPYCGYVDTHKFSRTPMDNFVRVGALPKHQEKGLHMLDSIDYAANAGAVPVVAAMGEKDPFFEAHVLMGQAMEREGLRLLNLISPGTGHVQEPATHREQLRRLGEHAARGLNHAPKELRFVTWTLKYNRCHWVELLGLGEHYARSEVRARIEPDGSVRLDEPMNVTRLAIHPPALAGTGAKLFIGGRAVSLSPTRGAGPVVLERLGKAWVSSGEPRDRRLKAKRPGLQGPIDDAFTRPFLCVRGTGDEWNGGGWADASLRRFENEWHRYFRGKLPVKKDTDVTEDDLRHRNIVLFGDPGSNRWIRKVLPSLPIRWTRKQLWVNGRRYDAGTHAPALIYPNPLPGAGKHYLVLNSGHTFHEKELGTLNYLLFPRLGDWAVLQTNVGASPVPLSPFVDEPVEAGYFDEHWRFPQARQ